MRYFCIFCSPVIYWRVNSLQETIAQQTIELTFEPFFNWTNFWIFLIFFFILEFWFFLNILEILKYIENFRNFEIFRNFWNFEIVCPMKKRFKGQFNSLSCNSLLRLLTRPKQWIVLLESYMSKLKRNNELYYWNHICQNWNETIKCTIGIIYVKAETKQ
jgi:hypothetical protein